MLKVSEWSLLICTTQMLCCHQNKISLLDIRIILIYLLYGIRIISFLLLLFKASQQLCNLSLSMFTQKYKLCGQWCWVDSQMWIGFKYIIPQTGLCVVIALLKLLSVFSTRAKLWLHFFYLYRYTEAFNSPFMAVRFPNFRLPNLVMFGSSRQPEPF